ncbi:acyl-CoA carboxylase subunit epsilon [Microbacterium sp. BR1]|uniref:acyl-CoA carboxylase subunit epsilon n=1 Tax=Microbacterium sp. BR1 TaxID=1070896 RepID=UPI000C2CA0F9|nr:acyl-CoA carboxylase subunit epsilon [Microbacterium sp. BR1]
MSTSEPVSVEVLRGAADEQELAALLAVVTEAYVREADAVVAEDDSAMSAWARSARALRPPLERGLPWGRSG